MIGHDHGKLVTIPDDTSSTNVVSTGQFGSATGLTFEERMDRGAHFSQQYDSTMYTMNLTVYTTASVQSSITSRVVQGQCCSMEPRTSKLVLLHGPFLYMSCMDAVLLGVYQKMMRFGWVNPVIGLNLKRLCSKQRR
eukprot:SAG31_NODE_3008_length_4790_cov_327.591132_5_plen_137_part_00